jgi:hypothetical protein
MRDNFAGSESAGQQVFLAETLQILARGDREALKIPEIPYVFRIHSMSTIQFPVKRDLTESMADK